MDEKSNKSNSLHKFIIYYLDDDKLRLLFIVVLLIGIILLLTGVKQALLFMVVAFAIIAFLCIFKPRPQLMENFICDSFYDIEEDSRIGITHVPDSIENIPSRNHNPENPNIKFKNSTRN
jgi:hypothetical protein